LACRRSNRYLDLLVRSAAQENAILVACCCVSVALTRDQADTNRRLRGKCNNIVLIKRRAMHKSGNLSEAQLNQTPYCGMLFCFDVFTRNRADRSRRHRVKCNDFVLTGRRAMRRYNNLSEAQLD